MDRGRWILCSGKKADDAEEEVKRIEENTPATGRLRIPEGAEVWGIMREGYCVSWAAAARGKDGRLWATVETHPGWRRKGYAVRCLKVLTREAGEQICYACEAGNEGSLRAALNAGYEILQEPGNPHTKQ